MCAPHERPPEPYRNFRAAGVVLFRYSDLLPVETWSLFWQVCRGSNSGDNLSTLESSKCHICIDLTSNIASTGSVISLTLIHFLVIFKRKCFEPQAAGQYFRPFWPFCRQHIASTQSAWMHDIAFLQFFWGRRFWNMKFMHRTGFFPGLSNIWRLVQYFKVLHHCSYFASPRQLLYRDVWPLPGGMQSCMRRDIQLQGEAWT